MVGGGDHGHGHSTFKIPDHNIYRVEDVPELLKVKEKLAKRGLTDPWLRNEVWRYHADFGTRKQKVNLLFFRGFKLGFALFALTIACEKGYEYMYPQESHHHH